MARTPLPSSTRRRHWQNGFSLGEAMVAMAIVGILAGMALPGFGKALERHRATATLHALTMQLASARSTAVTRRMPVTLCPSDGSGRCRGDRDWSQGWLMYLDPGRKPQPANPAHVLRNELAPAAERLLVKSSTGRTIVRFSPDGRTPGSNVTLTICSERKLMASIVINNVGRVRSQRPKSVTPCPA